jgi:hypothetical protein
MQPAAEQVGERAGDGRFDRAGVIARADVGGDDDLVLEAFLSFDEVVKVHVAELVDFLFAMVRRYER